MDISKLVEKKKGSTVAAADVAFEALLEEDMDLIHNFSDPQTKRAMPEGIRKFYVPNR